MAELNPGSRGADDAAWEQLAAPPRQPTNPNLFSSNTLFGQPGLYPDGTPMVPALDRPWTADAVRAMLSAEGQRAFDGANLVAAVPDVSIRAAVASLVGTAAEPLVQAFGADTTADRVVFGVPASPGRVVGPEAALNDGPGGDGPGDDGPGSELPVGDARQRVVNERYRGEHPTLLAPSLVHDLLWTPANNDHSAETILHALVAIVHAQLIARDPGPAIAGTELARRQNSLLITLLHSRQPGSARVTLMAPDGVGTVPGGAPSMQSADFWSVPFGPAGSSDAPKALRQVLETLVPDGVECPLPLRFDAPLGRWISDHLDPDERRLGPWLPAAQRWRVLTALGLTGGRAAENR